MRSKKKKKKKKALYIYIKKKPSIFEALSLTLAFDENE